jgi:hypothetical protein
MELTNKQTSLDTYKAEVDRGRLIFGGDFPDGISAYFSVSTARSFNRPSCV